AVLPSLLNGALQKAEAMTINSGLDENTITTIGTPPGAGLPFQVYFVIDPGSTNVVASNADMLQINLYDFLGSGSSNISLEQAITQGMANTLAEREDKVGTDPGPNNTSDYDQWLSLPGTTTAQDNALRLIALMGSADESTGLGLMAPGSFSFDTPSADGGHQSAATFATYLIDNYGTNALEGLVNTIVRDGSGNRATTANEVDTYLQNLTGLTKANLQTAVNTWLTTASASTPSPTSWNHDALANTFSTSAESLLSTPLTLQIGADYGQELGIKLYAGALGNLDFVSMVNVQDQTSAAQSITTLDRALAIVDDARGKLGGYEGQLNYTLQNLQTTEENEQAANSQIRDADMANEATNLVRSSVLAQASSGSLKSMLQIEKEQVNSLVSGLRKPTVL
ncbi:MAG TPA: flagellin, partial [Oscillatoriaceae cyanobacterium]